MLSFREMAKRWLPASVKDVLREHLLPPPQEDVVLHDYQVVFEPSKRRRLSLVIPTIAIGKAFGGVMTGIDIFLEIGKRTGADLRIILDNSFMRSRLRMRSVITQRHPIIRASIGAEARNPRNLS